MMINFLKRNTENNISFPFPVKVKIGDQVKKVEMINGKGSIGIPVNYR